MLESERQPGTVGYVNVSREVSGVELAESYAVLLAARRGASLDEAITHMQSLAEHVAVPLSQAAEHLHVSVPTVRVWASRGVLEEIPGLPVRCVSAASLARALDLLHAGQEGGVAGRQLGWLAEQIRDQALHTAATHVRSEQQHSGRHAEPVTDDELDSL